MDCRTPDTLTFIPKLMYLFSLLTEYVHTVITVVTQYDVIFSVNVETNWIVRLFTDTSSYQSVE